ncbi:MAG: hypothetical protein K2P81_14440 [Bacteriovoracaceae bacterium]|nr:hypothetical protein [Bacteriovoracaceae bacterium]
MKICLALLITLVSFAASAITCDMSSNGNTTQVQIIQGINSTSVLLGEEPVEDCVRISSVKYSPLVRCGSTEDAMYFGINGKSGLVYASFGTVAQLKNCR